MPWHKLSAAMRDIVVFEPNMLDLHRILHLHGSFCYHLFMDSIPRLNLPHDIHQLIENSHCIPLRYRHVWITADDYQLRVVSRGEQWFECQTACRVNALSSRPDSQNAHSTRPDHAAGQTRQSSRPDNTAPALLLSVESLCNCYLNITVHSGSNCSCLCHSRICTHYLNDHTPKLESCLCVADKTAQIDGHTVCRAPYKRLVYTDSMFIFFIPESGVWFTSKQRNIRRAYESHLESFYKPQ